MEGEGWGVPACPAHIVHLSGRPPPPEPPTPWLASGREKSRTLRPHLRSFPEEHIAR